MDKTFGEIVNGYVCDREGELSENIEKIFMAKAISGDKSSTWSDESLTELWGYAIAEFEPNDPHIYLEVSPLFELISDLFDDAGAIEIDHVFEGGPGMSSALSSHYAEDPKTSFYRALDIFQNRLPELIVPYSEKAVSRLLPTSS